MILFFHRTVYIGLYGYDYLTAGKKVMEVFESRGWTTIVNDDLVMRVLGMMCLVIGFLTGCVGLLLLPVLVGYDGDDDASLFGGMVAYVLAFSVSSITGTAMSFILMNVVAAAVDTVIVAFAEAPLEFERNHPGLSTRMSNAWRQVYPEEFGR
jgi:hypothetical protein